MDFKKVAVVHVSLRVSGILIGIALAALSTGSDATGNWSHGGYGARLDRHSRGAVSHESRRERHGFSEHRDFRRRRGFDDWRFHRRRGFDSDFNLFLGSPFYADPFDWDNYGYQPPVYYVAPPAYYVAPRPRIYIQKSPQTPTQHYWYWCTKPAGYYPYVKSCPQPWQRVVPYGTPPH